MNKSWYNSISEHRFRIQKAIEKSGSLRRYLPEAVTSIVCSKSFSTKENPKHYQG